MKNIKEALVSTLVVGFILSTSLFSSLAKDTTSTSAHVDSVPKTISSTATHTVSGEVVDGISFYIIELLKTDGTGSDYTYIKVKLTGSSDTAWIANKGCYSLSGSGSSTCTFKLKKNTYAEIFTASTVNNSVGIYYYGNNSLISAKARIREGVNAEVSTSNSY